MGRCALLAAGLAGSLSLLGACSSSSAIKVSSIVTTATPSSTAAPTTAAPTTTKPPATTLSATSTTAAGTATTVAGAALEAALKRALLTTDEINAIDNGDMAEVDYQFDDSTPPPCGGQNPDKTNPPEARVGARWQSQSVDVVHVETLRLYASADEASAAFTNGVDSFSCGTSTDGTFTFSAPQDITATLSTDPAPAGEVFKVIEIDVGGEQVEGVLYLVDFSDSITGFQFLRAVGLTDQQSGANPQLVMEQGVDKLFKFAAGGG